MVLTAPARPPAPPRPPARPAGRTSAPVRTAAAATAAVLAPPYWRTGAVPLRRPTVPAPSGRPAPAGGPAGDGTVAVLAGAGRVGAAAAALAAPAGPAAAAGPALTEAVRARRSPVGRRLLGRWAAGGATVGVLALLAAQLRDAELGAAFAAVDPGMLAVAVGWFALSVLAAAYTVTGFSALPLRLGPTVLAQLAVGGLRLVVPAAASMPAVIVRYLTRSGAPVADAAATVAAGQAAQLVATVAVVAALGAGAEHAPALPGGGTALALAAGLLALLAAAVLAASRNDRVRAGLAAAWGGQVALARHARRHPGRVGTGLAASAALTLTHVLAFAACVTAAGGGLPLVTCAAIYLGAAAAGSLVPAPGGIGPVEAALVAGLTAAGLALPAATAAAIAARLVSVWLPAVPGLVAVAVLRRRALL